MKLHPVVFKLYSGQTIANADAKVTGITHYSMNAIVKLKIQKYLQIDAN
mgnify:CR=1 FL=1